MVATRECATLAQQLIAETCTKHHIAPGQLTVHADRGPSMTSKPVAFLLADLGVTKTHSRPYVSDDNPFSEAQFKTLKYRPDFPERFGSIEHARAHCRGFFPWYNAEHRHSGIALITPEDVHYGRTTAILEARAATLDAAFAANPNRFKGRPPTPQRPPEAVWINPPVVRPHDPDERSEQHSFPPPAVSNTLTYSDRRKQRCKLLYAKRNTYYPPLVIKSFADKATAAGAFASTTNGASVSAGKIAMHTTLR